MSKEKVVNKARHLLKLYNSKVVVTCSRMKRVKGKRMMLLEYDIPPKPDLVNELVTLKEIEKRIGLTRKQRRLKDIERERKALIAELGIFEVEYSTALKELGIEFS